MAGIFGILEDTAVNLFDNAPNRLTGNRGVNHLVSVGNGYTDHANRYTFQPVEQCHTVIGFGTQLGFFQCTLVAAFAKARGLGPARQDPQTGRAIPSLRGGAG